MLPMTHRAPGRPRILALSSVSSDLHRSEDLWWSTSFSLFPQKYWGRGFAPKTQWLRPEIQAYLLWRHGLVRVCSIIYILGLRWYIFWVSRNDVYIFIGSQGFMVWGHFLFVAKLREFLFLQAMQLWWMAWLFASITHCLPLPLMYRLC
jgi:hypothetical protein